MFYGDEQALSIHLAAFRYGLQQSSMRKTLSRFRDEGLIEPFPVKLDERTEIYPMKRLDMLMTARPGRGVRAGKTWASEALNTGQKAFGG